MARDLERAPLSRRTFLTAAGAAVAGTVTAPLLPAASGGDAETPAGALPEATNETLRMHADLRRALARPAETRRWAMVIDIRRCTGCNSCTVACIAENNLPPGVRYRTVGEVEDGVYPTVRRFFMPTNCMQCSKAPCIAAANKVVPGSMSRRPDGIVAIDYAKMKGRAVFEAASQACPYPDSLWYDEGGNYTDGTPAVQPYEARAAVEYGRPWSRKETAGSTRKCHFCAQRLDAGMLPACVSTCTSQAMHFGDLNDPKSLVSEILTKHKSIRLGAGKGADPAIIYVDDDPAQTCLVCHE